MGVFFVGSDGPQENEDGDRQAHLSLRFETRRLWRPISSALGIRQKPEQTAAVALALYAEAIEQGRRVSYSRSKDHYDRPQRYRSVLYTYRGVVGAVDRLDANGLIRNCITLPGQRGWQSWMEPKAELIAIVDGIVGQNGLQLTPPTGLIRLKDADKRLIDYRDNRETDRMRRELQAQNEAIAAIDLSRADCSGTIDLQGHLRRIFNNGDFGQGGRFYAEGGAWQSLPKAERLKLRIDGEPVVEIDYSQLHPVLAYAECGHPFPGGAYDVPGYPRDLVKIAVAVLLNSASRNGARHTLAHKPEMTRVILGDDCPNADTTTELCASLKRIYPGYIQAASHAADRLIEVLLEKHDAIRSMFFTGAGLRLQRLDSDIAEAVMRTLHNRGITVLPIHDSFLVQASKADLLEAVMQEESERAGFAVSCKRSPCVSIA